MGIIEELYYNYSYPGPRIVPKDPDYRANANKISEAMGEWKEKLTEEDYGKLIDLLDLHHDVHSFEAAASFTAGFKLGASIMVEVHSGKNEFRSD